MSDARTICVMGLGYIGLPTASLLATKGYRVHGVDVKAEVVETINDGRIHITEPELDVLVRSAVQSGRLSAALEPTEADVFILSVPTPFGAGHAPDLSFVQQAAYAVASCLRPGALVILESTSPVGTTEHVREWLTEARDDLAPDEIHVAHCPERVLPGSILRELLENDRIVGGLDEAATTAAAEFYEAFVSGDVLRTTARTAELAKLTENTFRDVNIALANELSMICDQIGVDVWELTALANRHPRVDILAPGPGVGGHCLAVDPWFIVDSAPDRARLIRTAREVNDAKPEYLVQRVRTRAARITNPVIACFGLAYKADIDDLRESPAVTITRELALSDSGEILVVEPNIRALPPELADAGACLITQQEALERADIVLGLVNHRPFRTVKLPDLAEKLVFDTCGMWR